MEIQFDFFCFCCCYCRYFLLVVVVAVMNIDFKSIRIFCQSRQCDFAFSSFFSRLNLLSSISYQQNLVTKNFFSSRFRISIVKVCCFNSMYIGLLYSIWLNDKTHSPKHLLYTNIQYIESVKKKVILTKQKRNNLLIKKMMKIILFEVFKTNGILFIFSPQMTENTALEKEANCKYSVIVR